MNLEFPVTEFTEGKSSPLLPPPRERGSGYCEGASGGTGIENSRCQTGAEPRTAGALRGPGGRGTGKDREEGGQSDG